MEISTMNLKELGGVYRRVGGERGRVMMLLYCDLKSKRKKFHTIKIND